MKNSRLFTDKTIKRHVEKFGRESYLQEVKQKLVHLEETYQHKKKKLTHIIERIENDFS